MALKSSHFRHDWSSLRVMRQFDLSHLCLITCALGSGREREGVAWSTKYVLHVLTSCVTVQRWKKRTRTETEVSVNNEEDLRLGESRWQYAECEGDEASRVRGRGWGRGAEKRIRPRLIEGQGERLCKESTTKSCKKIFRLKLCTQKILPGQQFLSCFFFFRSLAFSAAVCSCSPVDEPAHVQTEERLISQKRNCWTSSKLRYKRMAILTGTGSLFACLPCDCFGKTMCWTLLPSLRLR